MNREAAGTRGVYNEERSNANAYTSIIDKITSRPNQKRRPATPPRPKCRLVSAIPQSAVRSFARSKSADFVGELERAGHVRGMI
ncbi:hypothetical protein PM082_014459 [Marasmius tenuissimus]|nr:hypothetical protein PM082_014459 [Marasmius tenuissimus]